MRAVFKELLETLLPDDESSPSVGAFEEMVHAMEDGVSAAKLVASPLLAAAETARRRDALRREFRKRAKETHPDCPGGSHDAFLAMKARYDAACSELEEDDAPAPVKRRWNHRPVTVVRARSYA